MCPCRSCQLALPRARVPKSVQQKKHIEILMHVIGKTERYSLLQSDSRSAVGASRGEGSLHNLICLAQRVAVPGSVRIYSSSFPISAHCGPQTKRLGLHRFLFCSCPRRLLLLLLLLQVLQNTWFLAFSFLLAGDRNPIQAWPTHVLLRPLKRGPTWVLLRARSLPRRSPHPRRLRRSKPLSFGLAVLTLLLE